MDSRLSSYFRHMSFFNYRNGTPRFYPIDPDQTVIMARDRYVAELHRGKREGDRVI